MLLDDKVAIVTGAGRGIGEAIAERLARENAKLVVVDIEEDNVRKVCNEIIKDGGQAFPFKADVADEKAVASLVEAAKSHYGQIDILVNNAGISPKKEGRKAFLIEIDLSEWTEVLRVNLTSVFLCCKAVLPSMMERKVGKIVNISSSAALDGGFLAASHYAASKGGVSALTRTLARQASTYAIRFNPIAPGRIQTPMALLTSAERNKEALSRIPLGRFGTPADVASAVTYLSSDISEYVTGITLNVSGGYVVN